MAALLAILLLAIETAPQPDTTGRVVTTVTTLEGTMHLPGVQVELRAATDRIVLAKTITDGAGQVTFPDVPPGRYLVTGVRAGFAPQDSAPFDVRANEVVDVLLDIHLSFVAPPVAVQASPSATDSVQPVSMSDMLSGSVLDLAPLAGDDFQSLLPLLPGIVRGPDGRLRIKGGQPTQGALQISSASLIDPSSGDFDLELPAPSVESVEVLANPFAAEYGRFSSSVTQIRTRRGTNLWEVNPGNLVPRFGKRFTRLRGFEPRLSVRGPIRKDRAFLAQDFQFRYVATPVKSLPEEPETAMRSFDSFTRVDTVVSSRHMLGGGVITFPRDVDRVTMSTFRPAETAPDLRQHGWSVGGLDRLAIAPDIVLETTLAGRWFEVSVDANRDDAMVYMPQAERGGFFNDQEREVSSVQWVEALSVSRAWWGQHVFKLGTDLQVSEFTGSTTSRPVEIRRLDGSLAERTTFSAPAEQAARGVEFSVFVQDRWRTGSRLTSELGMRIDRDPILGRVNWSPRAGAAIALMPEGRAILRGGYGMFVQRTPLNVDAFPQFESRTVARFTVAGAPLTAPDSLVNVLDGNLHTPRASVANVEWNQRFGRRTLLKVGALHRNGTHEFVLLPEPLAGQLRLATTGNSRFRELEVTVRHLGGDRKDMTVSYVLAKGMADLNNYDQFYGNFRNPIVRENAHDLSPTDVRHRLMVRGTIGLPGKWDLAPVVELRSGFPWSAVDEFHDFAGRRNRAGRLPAVRTLDFQLSRPWQFKRYRFRAGIRAYNLFGSDAARDVQNNRTAPDFGSFYNPIERSIGFTFGTSR